jgi:limonene 1,2-monooxygenase
MTLPARMTFGIFLAPFHHPGDNPTLALERDLELVQWLDHLGFDEAWIGEHHSAGWETIASPEIFIATAAERTRSIRLGTGVTSLPYHHPFMVASRMVLLDHLTRGRAMLGVGPGALASDAHILGIDQARQREMMDESMGVIMRLLTETEPFSVTSDWFRLQDAALHLRPYTRPHFPIAVASAQSPAGMTLAGKYGLGVLSTSIFVGVRGVVNLPTQWAIAEETAAKHGRRVDRNQWRLVIPVHLAESREEARRDVRTRAGQWLCEYFRDTIGRPIPRDVAPEALADRMMDNGSWIVGTADDAIAGIRRLDEASGGYGGLLILAHEWAPRDRILRSYELMARYVIPQFQESLRSLERSNRWAQKESPVLFAKVTGAIERAHQTWERGAGPAD